MKNYQAIILMSLLFINSCIAQTGIEKLYGTWTETHRDFVYYRADFAHDFTKIGSEIFKGSKIVFTKDTLFTYVTYLLENTISPVTYEIRDIKTNTLPFYSGNLSELLLKKGTHCKELTVKKKTFNRSKDIENIFYLFDDGTIALLENCALHYFNKISSENIGGWDKNEFGQTIIKGSGRGDFDIPEKKEQPNLIITYIPQKKGKNYFSVNKYNKLKNREEIIHKTDSDFRHNVENITINCDTIEKDLWVCVGHISNPITDKWEVRYKFVDNVGKIQTQKTTIFSTPEIPTKMYLSKGNQVEILKEENGWLNIRYYGTKTMEGWIKKEDVK